MKLANLSFGLRLKMSPDIKVWSQRKTSLETEIIIIIIIIIIKNVKIRVTLS